VKNKTKSLSGASQDAYFTRVLKAAPDLTAASKDQILCRLRDEIAQVRLRVKAPDDLPASARVPLGTAAQPVEAISQPASTNAGQSFDPYSPNVVVVVRKFGREAAVQALGAIENIDNLRCLAREQRLNVDTSVVSAAEMRIAIVKAAERRIANRVAAAG
jgi:hypothetical protein